MRGRAYQQPAARGTKNPECRWADLTGLNEPITTKDDMCWGTPSVQTLVAMASVMFQELEEVPMTMVGGLDVHRQQITFDYVDSDGLVR